MKKSTQNIYTILSNKYNLPRLVIEVICNHPFLFANRVISSNTDTRQLMFTYLGKVKIKKKYEENKEAVFKRSNKGSHNVAIRNDVIS